MKKIILTSVLLIVIQVCKGQPNITNLSYPSSVALFDMYEISFHLDPYSNPYDPDVINIFAIFTGPNNVKDTVVGFYYEGYTFQKINGHEHASIDPLDFGWKIRFTPDEVGLWSFSIHAIDQDGETIVHNSKAIPYVFNCYSVSTAKGFISKANTRFLKRQVVNNGQKEYHSFFPIGPNVAWYSCNTGNYGTWDQPIGIYDYQRYIDSLSGNGNYMRVWLNRYQYLNLYGPEYTQKVNGEPKVYFDSIVNQKDAAELDHIITYARQNDISLMLCVFTFGDFRDFNEDEPADPNIWVNNPYNTILTLTSPCQFFEDDDAKKVTKNLIRYIVARWGYATNVMSWELWNEVTNMPCMEYPSFEHDVFQWHEEMSDYIKGIDPFNHCISTSMTHYLDYSNLYSNLYYNLDFVQKHNYQNINKAKSSEQSSYKLFNLTNDAHVDYPSKPFFVGESGFGKASILYLSKDPHGIDLHNWLWSSLFSTSMGPASYWYWDVLDSLGLFTRFKPVFTFCQNLPIPSSSFHAYTTGFVSGHTLLFPGNIETYYMKNSSEDTIYGWCQDTAFCYQSLRWLTDSVAGGHFIDSVVLDPNGYVYTLDPQKRPRPSSDFNNILIHLDNMPVGTFYEVHWFNSETGLEYNNETTVVPVQQTLMGRKYIVFYFPSRIRNLHKHTITNNFGDAVFAIYRTHFNPNKKEDQKTEK